MKMVANARVKFRPICRMIRRLKAWIKGRREVDACEAAIESDIHGPLEQNNHIWMIQLVQDRVRRAGPAADSQLLEKSRHDRSPSVLPAELWFKSDLRVSHGPQWQTYVVIIIPEWVFFNKNGISLFQKQ